MRGGEAAGNQFNGGVVAGSVHGRKKRKKEKKKIIKKRKEEEEEEKRKGTDHCHAVVGPGQARNGTAVREVGVFLPRFYLRLGVA